MNWELDEQDLTTLMEACDAWVEKDAVSLVMSTLVGGLMGEQADREAFAVRQAERDAEWARQKRQREERIIMLKAKLLRLRDSATAASLAAQAGIR